MKPKHAEAATGPATSTTSFPAPLAAFVAGSPASILVVDEAGTVVYANHGPKGEPADRIVGSSIVDLVTPER